MFFSSLDSMKSVCSKCVIQSGSVLARGGGGSRMEDVYSVRSCIVSVCVDVQFLYVCSYMCVWVCTHRYIHICLCICVEARGQCQVSLSITLHPYFFETVSLTVPGAHQFGNTG